MCRPAAGFAGRFPLGDFLPKTDQNWIVETDWLANHLQSPDLIVLDGSWHLPTSGRDPKAEYKAEHIPGSVHLELDDQLSNRIGFTQDVEPLASDLTNDPNRQTWPWEWVAPNDLGRKA